ncbi:MAG: RIP metalloprotease RseP [Deltaproteobacteria bacterium]|nr:MAG: RIP metalloprotease RseP [Deltaproteobacteria bacterium]
MGILFFLLLIGPLIFFHELGHFAAARVFGVKCEQFAIGFGPAVARWRPGETEYSLRALPLGGYVQMLGMFPEEEIDSADEGRALHDKPKWQRMIIYLAGPVMNLLIPIPIFFLVLFAAAERTASVAGVVAPDSPAAAAGLMDGDEIVAVDGSPVRFFDQLTARIRHRPGEEISLTVLRDGDELELTLVPESVLVRDSFVGLRVVETGRIGIMAARFAPIIDVVPEGPADAAGLLTFDRIERVDGEPVASWHELRSLLEASRGMEVTLDVLRTGRGPEQLGRLYLLEPVSLALQADEVTALGIRSAEATVFEVLPGSPAADAGLMYGDRVVGIDGRTHESLLPVLERLHAEPDRSHLLDIERNGERITVSFTPSVRTVTAEFRQEREHTFIGFRGRLDYEAPELRPMTLGQRLWYAFSRSFAETFGFIGAMILGVWYLIVGTIDTSALGGPILIADLASQAGHAGWEPFLRMMAIISVNLGIINLLPLPGLDGGHLMILTVESIKRGPISNRTRQILNFVGIVTIVLLMLFAFKNDIERYWIDVRNWLNS